MIRYFMPANREHNFEPDISAHVINSSTRPGHYRRCFTIIARPCISAIVGPEVLLAGGMVHVSNVKQVVHVTIEGTYCFSGFWAHKVSSYPGIKQCVWTGGQLIVQCTVDVFLRPVFRQPYLNIPVL